ncbi:uncharacterized protein Fot_43122 [Forsythia ovata]|uniref:beta-glucosidase n=1 Tax=Forsythia ovata TaxID=205694 RepID=A0ABD1RN45_9LAMI
MIFLQTWLSSYSATNGCRANSTTTRHPGCRVTRQPSRLSSFCYRGEYLKYKDPIKSLSARIRDLLGRMTLEEKIGQMTQIERKDAFPDVMKKYFIGSVLSGGGSVPAPKATAETWVNMVNELQKCALSTRLGIPMIYGIDAVHGNNNVYRATIFPHNVGLGVTRQRIGAATALEVRATGIQYAFSPCIASHKMSFGSLTRALFISQQINNFGLLV